MIAPTNIYEPELAESPEIKNRGSNRIIAVTDACMLLKKY